MSKHNMCVEWIVAKDDDEWKEAQQGSFSAPQPLRAAVAATGSKRRGPRWLIWALTLVLLNSGAVWLWRTSEAGLRQIEREVGEAVQVEVGALAARDPPSRWEDREAAVQASALGEMPQIETEVVALRGDRVAARVLVQTEKGEALRQMRFYRRSEKGWRPVAPDESLWGPLRRLESDYFIFSFHQPDAQAVVAIAGQMDQIYSGLLSHFGLPQPATKQVIEISMLRKPGMSYQLQADVPWIVASPALYLAPLEVSDGALLAQSIALVMLQETLDQAQEQYGVQPQWLVVYSGLHLWQLWELDLPLAQWRHEILTWHFGRQPESAGLLPEHYDELCAAHDLWMYSPAEIHIPYMCNDTAHFMACSYPHDSEPDLARLERICAPFCAWDLEMQLSEWLYCPGAVMMLATVIDYAVDEYGEAQLPLLLAGLSQYENWQQLLSGVYGVSPEEFEQGWQAHINARYP